MNSYFIPVGLGVSEVVIKKSRFITYIAHTEGIDAAKQQIQAIRQQHPGARHHCWAYIAGAPSNSQQLGFSDNGEPSGTAGKPMLAQLLGSGLGEITAVVVRYYGGVMLGTGGLVKAYGGGVQLGLQQVQSIEKIPKQIFKLHCHYAQMADVERIIHRHRGEVTETHFLDKIEITLALPPAQQQACNLSLSEFSRGELALQSPTIYS